jgi:hypothetical protein
MDKTKKKQQLVWQNAFPLVKPGKKNVRCPVAGGQQTATGRENLPAM